MIAVLTVISASVQPAPTAVDGAAGVVPGFELGSCDPDAEGAASEGDGDTDGIVSAPDELDGGADGDELGSPLEFALVAFDPPHE